MEKYVILSDITCDLSSEARDFCSMEDYLYGHIHVSGEKGEQDVVSTLDWSEWDRADFYRMLGDKHYTVSTSPPNVEECAERFERYIKEGYGVISISLSAKTSGTYDFTCVAAKRVLEKYPEARLVCVDSMRMASGYGLLVLYAHLLRKEGKSFDEVIAWLEANKRRVHQMGPIDDLITVAKRGRLTMGKAIMGSFAGVKPMGDCNAEGYVTVLTKAKGIRRALELTVRYIKETAVDPTENYCIVGDTDREQYAETLCEMLEREVGFKKVFVCHCSSSNAVNIGQGMIGAYYFGEEITDLEREREIMSRLNGK